MNLLQQQLPPETNIPAEYDRASDREQNFIRGLSLFFVTFMSKHLDILEKQENQQQNITAMMYLVHISMVDDEEIFKICLEFWNRFSEGKIPRFERHFFWFVFFGRAKKMNK